ncbi:amino acid/amide ABC transporter ATP-binding protein 1, HAAT family [Actinacidiphila yanglinensis]|uniref:Amino acid/amide ABC transporter ATP-binding protein 1, HAAT family n=1 Tax=Actinacidiphila yanglinensis TaxID=310779 RepID=A0A1H5XWD4_9ACTN|nr:ABC transporter ATP-binding protein [Actinacidiphila yanglinensis]SEG15576.1 amino acid/amide ABC transporter ATP-binding protein 1, HAAT family [Actinacidiphila yanglinensis]
MGSASTARSVAGDGPGGAGGPGAAGRSGAPASAEGPGPGAGSPPSVLGLSGLAWRVGGATILQDVSLDVRQGEFLAFIGPNGAGKTSLFNLISGLHPATSGTITLDGADITGLPVHARARRGLGRTFQTSSLWPALTVAEHIRLAAQAAAGGSYRIWRRAGRFGPQVARTLERTGLGDRAGARAAALSHGEKRKLELAVLLVAEPRLMLLDEPMAGVSAEEVPALTELIRSLHRDEGRTVLMVEHHMDVLLGLADRLAVMHHGTLLALDTPDAVMADATVQQAYLGEDL